MNKTSGLTADDLLWKGARWCWADGKPVRVSILRNSAHWLERGTADDVRKELERVSFDAFESTAFEYLLGLAAEEHER